MHLLVGNEIHGRNAFEFLIHDMKHMEHFIHLTPLPVAAVAVEDNTDHPVKNQLKSNSGVDNTSHKDNELVIMKNTNDTASNNNQDVDTVFTTVQSVSVSHEMDRYISSSTVKEAICNYRHTSSSLYQEQVLICLYMQR